MLSHPILAIDHGEARFGLAITDPVGIMAHPLETIQVSQIDPITRILEIIRERQVQSIIIGLPLRMDGSEGKATLKIRKFKNDLKKALTTPLDIEMVDERMTTISASAKLHQAGKNSKKQKDIIDQAAAVEILNSYMQSQDNPYGLEPDPDSGMFG